MPSIRPNPPAASDSPGDGRAESARYALFGRILPALRHALVGELQALKFGVNLARAGAAEHAGDAWILDLAAKLEEQAGRSSARASALTNWYQPDIDATASAGHAIEECLALLRTEWQMRGIEVDMDVTSGESRVRSWAFRELLAAFLIALADELPGAADVKLRLRGRGNAVLLSIRGASVDREGVEPRMPWPRRLSWSDVDALARAHAIRWARRGCGVAARFSGGTE